MLVGEGARKWAREHNIEEIDEDLLKTENIIKSHRHFKQKLLALEKKNEQFFNEMFDTSNIRPNTNVVPTNKPKMTDKMFDQHEMKTKDETISLDTVGAIVLDKRGCLASAVSSGGILLKYPGRIGHSSMFGCGCWVDETSSESFDENGGDKQSIAVCTTGCGEYIIKTLFAKECAEHILRNKDETEYNLNEFFKKKFFSNYFEAIYLFEEKVG